jgi:threonine/homoserine/homoserine lactone efflux protein
MTLVTHFLIAFAISFVGSIPFGMVNMTVAHTAIRKGMTHALFMALGVSLVELLQAYVAIKFTWLFNENPVVERIFQIVAAIVFFAGAIYFLFFAKATSNVAEAENPGRRRNDFIRGMFISSLNLMIFPYWIFYATLLTANGLFIKDDAHVAIFALGTAVGTFALLVCYSLLGAKILSKSEQITRWVNKFIGLLLLGFGVYQLLKMLEIV